MLDDRCLSWCSNVKFSILDQPDPLPCLLDCENHVQHPTQERAQKCWRTTNNHLVGTETAAPGDVIHRQSGLCNVQCTPDTPLHYLDMVSSASLKADFQIPPCLSLRLF